MRRLSSILVKTLDARGNLAGVIAYMQGRYASCLTITSRCSSSSRTWWKVQAMLGLCEKEDRRRKSANWLEQSFPHLEEPKLKTQAGLELAGLDYQVGDWATCCVISTLWQLDPEEFGCALFG